MAFSVANHVAWDFTQASNPLVQIAGTASTVVNGGSINTTDGIVIGAWENAYAPCSNGGDFSSWAYPYTFVIVVKVTRTGASGSENMCMMRMDSGMSSRLIGGKVNSTGGQISPNNTTGYELLGADTLADATDEILIMEFRANGLSTWRGTTAGGSNTAQSLSMPTLNTTDRIVFGALDGNDPNMNVKGMALVPGALNGTDRTNLVSDWRAVFAAAGGGGALFRPYFVNG